MSGIFGRSQQPSGTADMLGLSQAAQGQQAGDLDQHQNRGVPEFEGAESGNISESHPAQGGNPTQGGDPNQHNQGDSNPHNQGDPNQQTFQFDPATAYAIQVANEAKVAAEVARQLAEKESVSQAEESPPTISVLEEFDDEELVSEGEKKLVGVAKKLEEGLNSVNKELHETKKQLKVAEDKASKTDVEFDIQRTIAHYGVTRAELETAYQRSHGKVEDLSILAESALYARLAQQQHQQSQEQVQNQVQQAAAKRGQDTGVVGQQQSSNGNTGTQSTNTDGRRGGGKLDPFDGASIAQHYSAFA